MPFHCDVCGSTLKGDYDKCPVCAKIDEAAKELLGDGANATMLTDKQTSEISIAAIKDAEAQETGKKALSVTEILDLAGIMRAAKNGTTAEKPSDPVEEKTVEQPLFKAPESDPEDLLEDIFAAAEEPEVQAEPALTEETVTPSEPVVPAEPEASAVPEVPAEPAEPEIPAEPEVAAKPEKTESAPATFRKSEDGLLEKQLIDQSMGVKKGRGSTASFILTLFLILAVVALGICTALFIVKPLIEQKVGDTVADSYVHELSGTWLSKDFTFADDATVPYAELLQINDNGTFAMSYLLTDPDNENGWKDGSWKVEYYITGTVKISAEDQRLLLLYEENGEKYYYDRYLISLSDQEMGLREYYDEERTSYYDVTFTKVAEASGLAES